PPQDVETIKIDTNLVTVPVVATDANGVYVADLKQEEFVLTEDGVQHQIAFFGKVSLPFHVVLMLDTSSSTKDSLRLIRQAALAFVQQLQPADRVKVISFDDKVRDLNEFTNNRETLEAAIYQTRSGEGTKVYDAFELAMNTIRRIQGRKAIVLFSDGMDWHSDTATYNSNVRYLDEEGVIVYPIRYNTRATTEQLAREQSGEQLPTISVIRQPVPSGTTAPTFPGGDPVPTTGSKPKTGPFGLPTADEIMRRRREEEMRRQPYPGPDPNQLPEPPQRVPEQGVPRVPGSQPAPPGSTTTTTTTSRRSSDDSVGRMLDMAYSTADKYLETLAEKSGGRMLRADTIASLPDAFSQIAAELRTQYLLGYYPLKKERDEQYRKIKVTTARKNVIVRARPGYLPTATR
ncbi:MAG TPA: VWA domain-containing protein, partial [Pyrinomonadaceae bacterium]|nr:VWA domain-containing protein [Pyrinomonadaceae bacterium]